MHKNKILYFNTFFFTGMWVSKTIQPIYWNNIGSIHLFSWSYVAMACMGLMTFLYSKLIYKFGVRNVVILGSIFYSIGLFLRAYPINLEIAILSGAFAGIGAGSAILAKRFWFLEYEDDSERQKIISYTSMAGTFINGFAVFISGWLVVAFKNFGVNGYKETLIFASIMVLFVIFYMPKDSHKSSPKKNKGDTSTSKFILNNKKISIILGLCRFISGAIITLIIPLLPLYLKGMGIKITNVSLILSIGLALSILLKFYYGRKAPSKYLNLFYLIFSIGLGLSCWLFFKDLKLSVIAMISIVFFNIFLSMSSMIFATIQLKIFPKNFIMHIFIITQTAFLSGEILGGALSSYFYLNNYLVSYSWVVGIIIVINSFLFIYGVRGGDIKLEKT